jgi:putative ABC transport system permease protein
MQPRWRKVLSDLWSNKTRTILVGLSISIGVFAVGIVSSMGTLFIADLDADFASVNPHGARLYTSPFSDDLLNSVRRVPGVGTAEGRSYISVRLEAKPGDWQPSSIAAIPPLSEMQIDRLRGVDPALKLGPRDILIERSALAKVQARVGDEVNVELADGSRRSLRVAGIVHDVSVASMMFTGQIMAFVSPEAISRLGGPSSFNQILISVAENGHDEKHVRAVAEAVGDQIKRSGRALYGIGINRPGEHPVRSIVQTLMVVLLFMGVLLIGLSTFLVINTMTALLSQHMRQIGMMKAIGARRGQIMAMYVVLALGFGAAAWLLAVPLSVYVGYQMSEVMAGMMNFNLAGFRVSGETVALQSAVALLTPAVAAVWPVIRGTRITVREAMSNYGLGRGTFGRSLFDRVLEHIRLLGMSRPVLISVRNTFRRKARLLLTLSTLTLAGAIFISVIDLKAAFDQVISDTLGYFLSDINLNLSRAYRVDQIEDIARSVPGVARVEHWSFGGGQILAPDGKTGVDIQLIAPPAESDLIKPALTAGRWLVPGDENAIVIGNHMVGKRPDLKVGDNIYWRNNDKDYTFHIVGIFKLVGNAQVPILYANRDYVERITNSVGRSGVYRIVTTSSDAATEKRVANALEQTLKQAGIDVSNIQTSAELIALNKNQTDILVYFLLFMSVLIALVGGIGLMGTMGINVLERTREIGVLRSIGASNGAIMRLILVEGMMIGLLSWAFGALLSLPLGKAMCDAVGLAFVTAPLPFVFAANGVLMWLAIVLVVSVIASILPAWNAMRLTVRDVLAYE